MAYQKISPEYIDVEGSSSGDILTSNGSNTYWSTSPFLSATSGGDVLGQVTISNTESATTNTSGALRVVGGISTLGNVIANSVEVYETLDFTPIDHRIHKEGRTFYDSTHNTLNYYTDIQDFPVELGENVLIRVFNDTGITLTKGAPITLFGVTTEGTPKGTLADASSASLYNFSGLSGHNIANNSFGFIIATGIIRGIDTSSLTEGGRVFVGYDSPGTLVQPSPSYPNFPMCVGYVVKSDVSDGEIVIEQQNHSVPSFRIVNDAWIGGTLTAANLQILGTQTTVALTNLEVADSFIYLGGGDTITTANATSVVGLNDLSFKGHYEGSGTTQYYVQIDGTAPDTIKWSFDDFVTTEASGITITGLNQTLANGISVFFEATTGHTLNDKWWAEASPINVDLGVVGNRNDSAIGGIGYTHLGWFFDVTDNKFKFFDKYALEIEGAVDTTHSSYQSANLESATINTSLSNTTTSNSRTINVENLYSSNLSHFTGANSTSNNTGTIIVTGGVGVSGNIYCSGELVLDGELVGDIEGVNYIYANSANVLTVNVASGIEFSDGSVQSVAAVPKSIIIAYNIFFN